MSDETRNAAIQWALATTDTLRAMDAARAVFSQLWESINGPGSWDKNPWVWAITFRRVE